MGKGRRRRTTDWCWLRRQDAKRRQENNLRPEEPPRVGTPTSGQASPYAKLASDVAAAARKANPPTALAGRMARPGKAKKAKQPLPANLALEDNLDALRDLASDHGLTVRASAMSGGQNNYHVMFDLNGQRILNWWPSTGTTLTLDGQRKRLSDCWQALDEAARLASEQQMKSRKRQ